MMLQVLAFAKFAPRKAAPAEKLAAAASLCNQLFTNQEFACLNQH
jgi:hypothetical protein